MSLSGRARAQQDACTGVATAFTIFSIFIVCLRVFTRTIVVHNFGKDDFMMVLALIFTIGYLSCIYVLRPNGMGVSGKFLTPLQMEMLVRTTVAIQVLYYIIIFSVKASILFCYLRIAVVKRFERATKYTMYFLATLFVICVIVCLTQCIPLPKMWDFTGMVKGKCINTTALFYTTSTINILTDIWIIALPIPTLLKIQRSSHEKIALVVVFSLGVFSCIASIVRLHSIRIYTESADPFYDSVPINLWSMVEVNIGIWCATIPALRGLITLRRGSSSTSNSAYTYHSREKSGKLTNESLGKVIREGTDGSNETESLDMRTMEERAEVTHPKQAFRKPSNGDSIWSARSQDWVYPNSRI